MIKKKRMINILLLFLVGILLTGMALGHGTEEEIKETNSAPAPTLFIIITAAWITLIVIYMLTIGKKNSENYKPLFFWIIAIPVILSTLYLAGFTIYENVSSETGGPVHWHADYEVYVCGEKLELVEPEGVLNNKIGTTLFHEHEDGRIHTEGTLKDIDEVRLGGFFEIIGGELEHEHLEYPTQGGLISKEEGDLCGDQKGELKVYVNGKSEEHYEDYLIYPAGNVPPGDCIIIEFGVDLGEITERLCASWDVQKWNYDSFERPEITLGGEMWQ